MSPRDGCYYVGLFAGIIMGVTGARALQWNHFIGLGIGLVLGIGLGYVCERVYSNMFAAKDDTNKQDENDQRQF